MADYLIHLSISTSNDIDPQEWQGSLNLPDVRKRVADLVGSSLTLPLIPAGKKYPEAGTFAVGSLTVERKK
jgi:hypothetical protein